MTTLKKVLANKSHGFQAGHAPHPRGGRPKGAKNKFPKTITEKIVAGIAASNKSIGDGIEGYAKFLADNHPQATASLMSKLVVRGSEDSNDVTGFHLPPQINLVVAPSSFFLSEVQIAALKGGRSIIDLKQCTPMPLEDYDRTNEFAANDTPPQFAPLVAERVDPVVEATLVETDRERWLRRAREDEKAGRSIIPREPQHQVRWPKSPEDALKSRG